MIFESLLPLVLLVTVPVVIILYLLKPKGKDYRISSTLLWEQLLRNQQSKTFLEKFIHNILMYLQILILLLLMLALMSPLIRREGRSGGNVILVFDESGSMQHDAGEGRTRMEEALAQAKSLIASSEGTAFSVIASDCMGTDLLAVGVKDKNRLYDVLNQVECCDGPADLREAESVVETLRGAGAESGDGGQAEVIVFTDGSGAEDAMSLSEYFGARIVVKGREVCNAANLFLSYVDASREEAGSGASSQSDTGSNTAGEGMSSNTDGDRGRFVVCASGLANYSDTEASMEISLYEGGKLRQIKQLTLGAGETTLCFFEEFEWGGETLCSEISSVKFAGRDEGDSLTEDNRAYAIPEQESRMDAVLIGDGNIYLEKAYQAAAGMHLTKVSKESVLQAEGQDGTEAVRIYDAETEAGEWESVNKLVFADGRNASGTAERVMLTVAGCDLTSGLSSFAIGVNETKVYEVPEWGTGFLWAGEQCAGYYGEHEGVKTVAVGFDIRESDFPLKAEFPVFISNALRFLGDSSLLADNIYTAGDRVLFHPQADFDVNTLRPETRKAGVYEVEAGDIRERYVVKFAGEGESDGRITAEGTVSDTSLEGSQTVKQRLRNVILILVLLLMALEWILYVRQTRSRSRFYLGVRIAGAAMVLLALFGVAVNRRDKVNTTIFLVDISNSNAENLHAMEQWLDEALQKMPAKNQYGIVTFGKDSLVEQFLTGEDHFSRIMSLPDKTATNFESAISRALAMIPTDGAGRVVVLTDGRETKGEIAGTASALMSRQIELLAYVYEVNQGQDAYVEHVELPGYLHPGDAYSMTVTVESNYETDARIQILTGTMPTEEYEVHLNRGANQFRFRQKVTGENVESFQVRVVAPGDTCEENNGYHAYSVVESSPKVLLVSGRKEDGRAFESLLDSAGCSYQKTSAVNAPSTLKEMLEFKSILLENVYLSDLPEGFLENIETYVKDYGCGLVCLGGEDSYALGGYRESVLETVLPVDMELRGVNENPATAMIMVIDHSGSMGMNTGNGATNLDLAITAAETAVDQMRSTDYVGVISFDDTYSWVVEPVQALDKKSVKAQIETIAEGGGTTIQPALRAALEGAKGCDVSIRHVILLTDGQGESRNYQDIISSYTDSGVTLSAVAVGEDSDARLLERLADGCGGRYYYSDTASDIPKIFAQEVFLSGDTYLQNGEFGLVVSGGHEITRGLFEDGWPTIYGYVSATPKGASRVLIASEKEDPILTVMQYGLGHTVAWNTDVTNRWTAMYAGENDYVQLWKRIIDYSAGAGTIGEDSVDVMTAGGYTDVVYRALDYGEQTKVEAVYTDPEGATRTVPLQASAPGYFEAKLDTDMTGVYNLSVRRVDGGEIVNAVTTAAAVQYSDEYKFDVSEAAFTSFVERYGRMLEPEENFWKQKKGGAKERYELTQLLILLAVLWFVMDIALRRFCFLPQDTKWYRMWMAGRRMRPVRRENRGPSGDTVREACGSEGASADAGDSAMEENSAGGHASFAGGSSAGGDAPAAGRKSAGDDASAVGGKSAGGDASAAGGSSAGADSVVKEGRAGKRGEKKEKKAQKERREQSLDTSALLKKKDQRNS